MEFSKWEYWRRLPFPSPGDLPDPWIEPGSPALQADSLLSKPLRRGNKGDIKRESEGWQRGTSFGHTVKEVLSEILRAQLRLGSHPGFSHRRARKWYCRWKNMIEKSSNQTRTECKSSYYRWAGPTWILGSSLKEGPLGLHKAKAGCDCEPSHDVMAHLMCNQSCLARKDPTALAQNEILQPLP